MTTDRSPAHEARACETDDRRAHLERLRQQRAAAAASGETEANRHRRRPRRNHAAAGGRILVAGFSAGGALALMAAMAIPSPPTTPANPPDAPASVVVGRRPSGSEVPASGGPAPSVARTDAAPLTASHGS